MNVLEEFLERQKDFHTKVKYEILRDLNDKCSNRGTWKYEDGIFILHDKTNACIFILKGDFEPYVFNTLVSLPTTGYPTEENVYGIEDVGMIVEDLIEQYKVED